MSGLFDKLAAIARRDLLIAARYRNALGIKLAGMLIEVAALYYLARAVGPSFRPDGMAYFPFLLVGTGFYAFFVAGINSFVSAIHDAQVSGTMEVLVTTSTPPAVLLLLSAFSGFAQWTLQLVAYLVLGMALFRLPPAGVNLAGCLAVFALSLAVAVALGIAAAALQVSVQRGGAVVWLFGSVLWLLTGMMFPVSALPGPLQRLASFIPITYALDGLRLALMKGAGFGELARPLEALGVFALLLLPLSLLLFSHALRQARLEGTLSFY